jgi:hypothetical protein
MKGIMMLTPAHSRSITSLHFVSFRAVHFPFYKLEWKFRVKTDATYRNMKGIMGHMHAPKPDDHGDPGEVNCQWLVEGFGTPLPAPDPSTIVKPQCIFPPYK